MQFNWINWTNLAAVVCLVIINIIAARKDVAGSFGSRYRLVNAFEHIGRYGCMLFMFFPVGVSGWEFGFTSVAQMLMWICLTVLLLVIYILLWIRKSIGKGSRNTFFGLAVVPAVLFFANGVLLRHTALIICALIFFTFHFWIAKENV